jgi:hypothetical protein
MRGRPLPHALARNMFVLVTVCLLGGCGSGHASDTFGFTSGNGSSGSSSGGGPGDSTGAGAPDAGAQSSPPPIFTNLDAGPPGATGPSEPACPAGLTCNVTCPAGMSTTITGKVYDPAGNNPLYNAAVYVPASPLQPLPKGVLTGTDACSCGALFQTGAVTNANTAVDGSFTLTNVPVGQDVPLVIQIGKWRRQFNVNVTACQNNPQSKLAFLGTLPAGDTADNIPDIAVSTGGADTLECLLLRVGLPASEYVAGNATGGHIHIFSGGELSNAGSSGAGTGGGSAESPAMPGAPTSWTGLWDTQADLMRHDIVLLSCEGDETYNANPPALEAYLNAGGRAFGSHFHYAWFAGSLSGENVPPPPADWGTNLDEWGATSNSTVTGHAAIVQTLNGSGQPFAKGQALDQWLEVVDALGVEGAPTGQLPIFYETQNAGPTNKAQAWLTDDGTTDYLSFDTPVNAPSLPDGGPPSYCGRAVYAGVHVGADTNAVSSHDQSPPPTGCAPGLLSPQEKALEFMLFDLSSCVLPDTVAPAADAGLPPPPK